MKLHAVNGEFFMAQPHDLVFERVRGHQQAVGNGVGFYEEGMVAGGFKGGR